MKHFLVALLLSVLIVGGCQSFQSASLPQPAVVMRVLDPSLDQFATAWQTEAHRRFASAVVILVHGGDFVEGQWIVGDLTYRSGLHVRPVTDVIAEAQVAFPGRPVVLLACNPGHIELHGMPGVFYAMSSVWCVPDRGAADVAPSLTFLKFGKIKSPAFNRWEDDPDVVGNIFEFIEARQCLKPRS